MEPQTNINTFRWRRLFDRVSTTLFGDHRRHSLEHRLFNTISLLNAITNIGALTIIDFSKHAFLFLLHFITGILFLIFYYYSRFRSAYRVLYWPFVLLIAVFLFINALRNAGSMGGAHYYFIPALVIATILSGKPRTTALSLAVFMLASGALIVIEQTRPEWILSHSAPQDRVSDILGNFIFAQIFTGILIIVLTRNLNQERKKSDMLLLNILPESIAKELQESDHVEPHNYDNASVLFTDFVGFTHIAEIVTPQELLTELDKCFRRFDQITKKHKLEKIKTMGDSYMAVGGVPAPNHTHAVDCVLAALEIQQFMTERGEKKNAADKPYWQLRLGIHSGRLVAGVIGEEKFAYDVWGDTVNTASRLESSGVAGRINISRTTYEQVRNFFACEYRGAIAAKNKGEIDMYFVNGIRPDLSQDAEGRTPDEKFFELYRQVDHAVEISSESLLPGQQHQ